MNPDLKVLADNKDALLLAEIGGWLHDMGKCSDEMIILTAQDKPNGFQYDYKTNYSSLIGNHTIDILGERVPLKDLIEHGEPRAIGKLGKSWLIRYLGRCHAAAHIEKEGQGVARQTVNDTRLSDPFGFESPPLANLTTKLNNLPYEKITKDRLFFLKSLKEAFKNAPGDTERPINEVDLWDWSSIVAALYKSALAGALLGNKPEPNKLKWRLLALRMNSEQVWGNASKVPVLLERKEWLKKGLDYVKKLLEEDYPVGNEVYRDENGSIFVVPDIPELLKIRDSRDNKNLEELISERLGYEGEIVVIPDFNEENWWGQDPEHLKKRREKRYRDIKDEIPPIGKILSKEPYSPADAKAVQEWWNSTKQNHEICTISWLRPQGPTEEGFNRKSSDYWAKKVTGRAKDLIEKDKLKNTIWIDEATDINGRICLIAGKIDLREWLKPDGYINTLLVKPPEKGVDPVTKIPSFARIYRIWETSKTFWEEIENKFSDVNSVGTIPLRMRLIADYKQKTDGKKRPTINSAHQVELDGIRFSVFCAKENEFFIIENILRLARLMGAEKEHIKDYKSASTYIGKYISSKKTLKIFAEEKSLNVRQIGELSVDKVETDYTSFVPAIPILTEPSTFIAVVPANKALNIANAIKNKYEEEMNKVRNRLPLTVGLVFARSHTPISSIMDAGRRMLSIAENNTTWEIIKEPNKTDGKIELTLNKKEQCIKMKVDTLMGDKTPDVWYPYWQVESDADGKSPLNRKRQFIGHDKNIYVHVCDLQTGDKVKFTLSRFDFEFLDSAARRFEISYKDGKRRHCEDDWKITRPYYLEDLSDFEEIWCILKKNLKRTQIKNMLGLIETKREKWQEEADNKTFEAFVHNVVHNANWIKGKTEKINEIEKAAVSGRLNDIVELYMDILKDKEEYNGEEEST